MKRELVTDILDLAGLALVAAGAGFGAGRVIGWGGLAVAGVVVWAGSWFAHRQGSSR